MDKELLSKVENVGSDVFDIKHIGNYITYSWILSTNNEIQTENINIHELASKYKDYYYDNVDFQNKSIISGIDESKCKRHFRLIGKEYTGQKYFCELVTMHSGATMIFFGDSETEAVFKACEYIADEY